MGTQRKVGTSLNDARQQMLDEIVAAEPFATRSSVLAVSLEVMYRQWLRVGRDFKGVVGALGLPGEPARDAA